MSLSVWDFLAVIIALVIVRWLHVQRTRAKASNLPHPPGPPGLPLIGNLRDIPPNPAWLTYRQWSREYCSALVRLNVFGNNIVVVNSLEAVTDLLEKRSSVYSDSGVKVHIDWLDDVMAHLRLMAGSEIMRIAYGINVESKDDPYIVTAEHAVGSITATTNAGSYLVDTLPFLKHIPEWFPGATFKREAKIWRKSVMKMLYRPFDVVKKRMASTLATLFPDGLGKDGKDPSYMEGVIRGALGSMYTGSGARTQAILHDESVYPEPMTFNPDRFMKDGELNPEVRDPATAAFGYGRRICPGRFMAYESMWIAIAATLAVYTIEKAEGPDGTPITPNGDYEQGFLCYPKPFPCKIYPHHIDQEVLIRATARI
ncbi:hypothetical protein EW026_g2458 [Hermanssonia centrifuga]|uniref:Cytochrome P450 n=1 Tax=Hermanssonia centrifuga TaxID=98765 RepID=A0A4S4KNX7_9APHY|nr:hypothetical protein EW026_g2458 [Hermanssonia centrifuga]